MRYHIVKQSRGYKGGTIAGANDMNGQPLIRDNLEEAIKICDEMSKQNPVGYEVHIERLDIGEYSEPIYKSSSNSERIYIGEVLTRKMQLGRKCRDGKSRNFAIYFLNGVEILKLKIPFDTDYDIGHDRTTCFVDEYVEGNRLYITKVKTNGFNYYKTRITSYPLSKIKLDAAYQSPTG